MSYNYLPLDRKWLNFQQVKNLLEYDQLVSITFDAHERILKCSEYLDNKPYNNQEPELLQKGSEDILTRYTHKEIPLNVVKLILMLKIKSLSYGYSGVQIETVKRLMEMYNNRVFPVIYAKNSSDEKVYSGLNYLSLSLSEPEEVYFRGEKRQAAAVYSELGWSPLELKDLEFAALSTGTHVTTAFGLSGLIKAEQMLKMANVIAAMAIEAFSSDTKFLNPTYQPTSHKGQLETAAVILQCLEGSQFQQKVKVEKESGYSFSNIPRINGFAKDAFEYVREVFIKEANSVTEITSVFPDRDVIVNNGNVNREFLNISISFLTNSINVLIDNSLEITNKLLEELGDLTFAVDDNPESDAEFHGLTKTVLDFSEGIRALFSLVEHKDSLVNNKTGHFNDEMGNGNEFLIATEKAEKVLAVELLTAVRVLDHRKATSISPYLKTIISDFHKSVSFTGDYAVLYKDLSKTVGFVATYKF